MTILEQIAAKTRERVSAGKKFFGNTLPERSVPLRPFFTKGGVTLIAECKQASPSRGIMVPDYRPDRLARDYAAGGATALSVLTEPAFFLGAPEHLAQVREAAGLPVLRKDFMLDEWQIRESHSLGADCILLIASLLPDPVLCALAEQALELGMEVLLETHNEDELARAAALPATAIGINARDLATFAMDLDRVRRLRDRILPDRIAVAESGLLSAAAFRGMAAAGFDGFLCGEYFATAPDPAARVRESLAAIREGHRC